MSMEIPSSEIPIPPFRLTARLMHGPDLERARAHYLEGGRKIRVDLERSLPDDWEWSGKSVLEFGCGAGRVIRHLLDLAPQCELWGSDIDPECIEWDTRHLAPAASFVLNEELPPLPFPDGKFDLIYARSVFTHISTHWAAWLLELDRVLAPGGRLVVTIMSEAMGEAISGEPWDEASVGMSVYQEGQEWSLGGPMVLHSPWWIEEHWGRLFDIELLTPRGFRDTVESGQDDHGTVVLRKAAHSATVEELEQLDPAETREAPALHHEVLHLRAEVAQLRARSRHADSVSEQLTDAESRAAAAEEALSAVEESRSWRLTAPLRKAKSWFR